ncbi:S-layer homology domain-containing protein [Aminipila luticellarii]|uniref:S-layer homology domain-containing protein n=1 Tax=Aminipila luticellarii TaxID=2507160 RepID=A0A410PY53_9FIRM|nr:S-layer homology domain-containing protein [Aminipila luticellarii]QAT43834.1 S-layer homology domain-containing protein [Aminipila luticellarii]
MKKKLLSVMLAGYLLIGAASAAYAADGNTPSAGNVNYSDLKSTNWAYGAVSTMSEKGIVKGYQDGSFKPANTVTYGEFIKMALIAATGEDIGNSTEGNWAKGYYDKALELKYFGSTDIKADQLDRRIPRSDMALIISSILGDTKIGNYDELENSLKDVNAATKYDYDIIKAYAAGIITGYEDSTFRPENTLTRAESATVIYRLIDESKRVLPEEKKEESSSTSGTDIASVIKNYKTFGVSKYSGTDSDGNYEEWYEPGPFAEATSYEFVTDMSGYKIEEKVNNGTKGLRINGKYPLDLGWGNLYFMKDGELVEFTSDGIHESDITTIEYFVFPRYQNVDHVIGIMPNPLYQGK